MAEVAGDESSVSWYGTFVQVLLPGTLVGGLLGWAGHLRRSGSHRRRTWLATAPLLFAVAVFVSPEVVASVLDGEPPLRDGIGGGALAIPLFGMAGGFALSGRGPRPARIALGAVGLVPIPAWAIAAPVIGDEFALTTPRGAWIALYFYAYIAVLELACAAPYRSLTRPAPGLVVSAKQADTEPTSLR